MFESDDVIYKYTQDMAIEDGIIIPVGYCGDNKILFTSNLFFFFFVDYNNRLEFVSLGIELLSYDDNSDNEYMKLRVIDDKDVIIVENCEGITFMKKEDY